MKSKWQVNDDAGEVFKLKNEGKQIGAWIKCVIEISEKLMEII